MNRKDVRTLILRDDEHAVGALIRLFEIRGDDLGFNSDDTDILSSIAKFYQDAGFISDRQMEVIKKKLPKYCTQLLENGYFPLPNKKPVKKKEEVEELKAGEKIATLHNGRILIRYNVGGHDYNMKRNIKTLEGKRMEAKKKGWSCLITMDNMVNLQSWSFTLNKDLLEIIRKANTEDEIKIEFKKIKTHNLGLYQFQKEGIEFIQKKHGRVLLADQMGLGKTAQALSWIEANRHRALPALVVVPASVKFTWERESNMWMDNPKIQIIQGGTKVNGNRNITAESLAKNDITIINYDIVKSWSSIIQETNFKTLILDECHYIKSEKALRTKAVQLIGKPIPHIIALSGTPIVNRPIEIFTTINLIAPLRFNSRWRFAWQYCAPEQTRFGLNCGGASNTVELHKKLTESIMIRREKKNVLKDLPDKVRTVIPLEIKNRKEYDYAKANLIAWIRNNMGEGKAKSASRAEALVKIELLKQLTARGKIKQCKEWIRDFIDTGEKLVVFCTHREIIKELTEEFKEECVKIDGSVSPSKRKDAVDKFQSDDKIKLFIGNIKAAGVGLTLTASSTTCFIELGWTPGEHDQAEDRVHRIGQTADSVNAYYLLSKGTIDENISQLIEKKRKILAQVLDGKKMSTEPSIFNDLVNLLLD